MNKVSLKKVALSIAGMGVISSLMAQSSDALLDKLVEKGVLSTKEANELKEETDKNFTTAYSIKSGMPDWVKSVKMNGDFRARYDGVFQDNANGNPVPDRNRLRYRLRFGPTISMTDNFEIGLRLGSGDIGSVGGLVQPVGSAFGGNVFSANTTLNGDASRKFLFVDAAYAKWTPREWIQLQFGKMDNLFWISDAAIDYDYQPEGGQEKLTLAITDNQKVNFAAGQWVISENYGSTGVGNQNDTYSFVEQIDWTAKWTKQFSTRLALSSISYKNQKDIPAGLEAFINQNGTPATGVGAQDFNPIIGRAEATYALASFPMFDGEFPITVSAEYINNPAASGAPFAGKSYTGAGNEAYNLGVVFGSAKKKGNWQIAYNYKNIEPASVWHGMNDDDFGFNSKGGTDVRGHHIKAWYKPYDSMTMVLSYFITEQINNPSTVDVKQDRLFFDVVWAF
ncbi:MAG: hypothetical protein JWN25_3027 [Verrucomicrobiales bacterium]|nr:hypothetical protein [Verrucomicrobiales bacterium]